MILHVRSSLALAVSLVLLAACGGETASVPAPSGGAPVTPVTPAATGLAGSVAVGVPITQGKLRVLDATGTVVAQDIAVAADGSYNIPTLTGTAPWRIEACGYVGSNYECIYSVAQATGTANVTPLTTAAVLLAANQQPGALMTGAATGLSAAALDGAQTQLRTGLSSVMNGNVASDFNFVTGSLAAGTRSGYDRLLDAIGVSTGQDGGAFVQITPRLGSGNLYMQNGASSGTVTADSSASALPLSQIDALFTRMTAKLASEAVCVGQTGLATEMAANARVFGDGDVINGAADVAALFCGYFGEAGVYGATLLSPTLGRCVTTGADTRCRVGFDVRLPDGTVMPFASGMGVQLSNNTWKFMGSLDPISIHMDARVQRSKRIDGSTEAANYMRAIAIDIGRVPNLECAKVSQHVTGGGLSAFAYLRPHDGNAERLSILRVDQGTSASLDLTNGITRDSDDTWYTLPEGTAGDEVVRNFFRNGRTVVVSTFSDAACATPLQLEGVSTFEVDIEGVPPVYAALATFPWPELTPAAITAVSTASLAANSTGTVALGWSHPNGRSGVNGVTFCGSLAQCGDQEPGRLGSRDISPTLTSIDLPLQSTSLALGASRTVSLYGTGPDGIGMQSNFTACGGSPDHCQ